MAAAQEHFRRYGFNKTAVADLAKAIGLSTAYIYKFFDSKQAIGEAVCGMCLGGIQSNLHKIASEPVSAAERLRAVFEAVARESSAIFFQDRKMHDIVAAAIAERWQATADHDRTLQAIVRNLVAEGRAQGEFERKTPMDETCRAIMLVMRSLAHPTLLEQNLDSLDRDATVAANLVLRSLAP